MKPITQISNTISTRTFSTQALRRISTATPEAFMRTTNDYVNARAKERNIISCNTKRTPATFEERADLNTPPAITDHVRELAQFVKNYNELARMPEDPSKRRETWYLSAIATNNTSGDKYRIISITKNDTANITRANIFPKFHAWRAMPGNKTVNGGYCEHHPCKAILFGGTYHIPAISNTNRADKPAFRDDSMYLFDILSEGYSA